MTVHAAKGLEFPYVFVVGMSEGVFPSSRIICYDYIEYVNLIEESQKQLFERRINNSETILLEKDSPTIQKGSRVRHKVFGEGTVIDINTEKKKDRVIVC